MSEQIPPIPGMVRAGETGGYFVLSRSTPGAWWFVWGDECSCPARVKRCFHVQQVERFVAALDDIRKRPSAKPNVSAMVD